MADEEALLVARAWASLPKDYEEVIRLRHWEDLSFDEIAARMGARPRRCESCGLERSHAWVLTGNRRS